MLADVPLFGGKEILLMFLCIVIRNMLLTLLPCYRSTYDLMRILIALLMAGTAFSVFSLLKCEALSSFTDAFSIHMTIL